MSTSDLTAEKIAQQFGLGSEHGQYAWRVMLNSPLDAERCQAIVSSPSSPGLRRADVCAVRVRCLSLRGRMLSHIGGSLLMETRSRSRRWTRRRASYASLRLPSSYVPTSTPPFHPPHINSNSYNAGRLRTNIRHSPHQRMPLAPKRASLRRLLPSSPALICIPQGDIVPRRLLGFVE